MAKDKNGKELPKGICLCSDGRYMTKITVDGKRVNLRDRDLKTLIKEKADRLYEAEHGLFIQESNITVADWFNIWMQEYKLNTVKFGTFQAYVRTFNLYIKEEIGSRKLSEVRPEHIQHIYNDLIKKKYSNSTIKLVAAILGGMFKQAYKNQMIQRNPVELSTLPKDKTIKKEIRVMSREEQEIFLKYARDSSYFNVYEVGLGTGMRPGEVRALEWQDIDFKKKEIHITGTLKFHTGEGYVKDTPKTKSSIRTIPMLDRVYDILKDQRKRQAELRLSLGELWTPEMGLEDLVFISPSHRKGYGRPVTNTALNDDLKKITKEINEAGIAFEAITPHTLRHTFATRGLEAGIPPKVMQVLLGHSSIQETMDTYSHVLPDMKAEEIQKIANLI